MFLAWSRASERNAAILCTGFVFCKLHYSAASVISVVLCDYYTCSANVFVLGEGVLQYNTIQYSTIQYNNTHWRMQEFCSRGGGVQQIQMRTEKRENGDLGAVAP